MATVKTPVAIFNHTAPAELESAGRRTMCAMYKRLDRPYRSGGRTVVQWGLFHKTKGWGCSSVA
jgi:hypothetical protein